MRLNRWLVPVLALLSVISLTGRVQAVEEVVQLPLQRAKCLCGVVTINGDPVRGATIEEVGPDWKGALRSTATDSDGRFALTPVKGRKIYYLQITAGVPGVNPLQVPVKISRFRGKKLLRLQLELA